MLSQTLFTFVMYLNKVDFSMLIFIISNLVKLSLILVYLWIFPYALYTKSYCLQIMIVHFFLSNPLLFVCYLDGLDFQHNPEVVIKVLLVLPSLVLPSIPWAPHHSFLISYETNALKTKIGFFALLTSLALNFYLIFCLWVCSSNLWAYQYI